MDIWKTSAELMNGILSEVQAYRFAMSLIIVAIFSTLFGWFLIAGLRLCIKKSSNPQALAYLPIISPILFYGFFSFLYHAGFISASIGDCATLFIMNGIILRLSVKSTAAATIRLAINVKDSTDFRDVWLKNNDITVGDARQLIAKVLNVSATRINIESGKGSFLKDISANDCKFLSLIESEGSRKDLFGFCTVPCYVTITEEVQSASKPKSSISRVFPGVDVHVKSSSIKYGSNIALHGKIPNSANDAKAFSLSVVNKFAAVAPTMSTLSNMISNSPSEAICFVSWREDTSDAASTISAFENSLAGQKVQNGEHVVLESNGCFMSVSKGWYVSWASDKPRRSGAFTIEIIKKAPQSIIGQGKDMIKEKVLQKEKENSDILRGGDIFRLRSVKFPSYELGVTSVRLKDNHFHVGLRKIDEDRNDWCLPLHLTARLQ